MTLIQWHEATREHLGTLLPEALVVLPVGATEQHGRHLATGTDLLLASVAATRAAAAAEARSTRPLVLAPALPFGASDHHLPFGGTLSLTPETLLAVLIDLLRSVARGGGRRVVLVNGHGGNIGVCAAAAAAASVRYDLAVAHVDYWRMAGPGTSPGHAGVFETSLVRAVRPDLAAPAEARDEPGQLPVVDGVDIYSAEGWRSVDGYTDVPDRADFRHGEVVLGRIVGELADRFVELARTM